MTSAPIATAPPVPAQEPSALQFLRLLRRNALSMWPEAAYRQPILIQPFFGRRRLLLNQPDAIHHVMVANTANYRRSAASIRMLRPLTGNGLLLSEGEAWRHQRRTTAPAFTPRVMPMLARHVAVAADALADRLHATEGVPTNLLALLQDTALDIAARSMFSVDIGTHGAALRAMVGHYNQRLAHPSLLDLILPIAVPSPRDLGRFRFRRRWMALMQTILDTRLAQPAHADTPRDLLDLLLAARDPDTGAPFPPDTLRDQVATLIIAGHETTAVALFWTLHLLADSPGWQSRIAAEAAPLALSPDTAADDLAHLPATRAATSEALRLYPPAFATVRQANTADHLPDGAHGTPVRPNDLLMVAPWVLHRHHAFWPNPTAFDPARFLPTAPPPPRAAYLPFGTGPRTCIGAQFATTELILVTARLLRDFTLSRPDPRPAIPVGRITTQPDHAVPFVFLQRR